MPNIGPNGVTNVEGLTVTDSYIVRNCGVSIREFGDYSIVKCGDRGYLPAYKNYRIADITTEAGAFEAIKNHKGSN